ncbi:MAG: putative porin, partial [Tannerella sp.]|nr:putative porin [Tannerella sp.]
MKHILSILAVLLSCSCMLSAQTDKKPHFGFSGFSAPREVPDSLLRNDSIRLNAKRITGYHLSALGDVSVAPMDTNRLNYAQSTLVEARSLAVAYLANPAAAEQTRIFSERPEARDFIFADAYDYYMRRPENQFFYNTKLPYTL